jgi:hypothetical protein
LTIIVVISQQTVVEVEQLLATCLAATATPPAMQVPSTSHNYRNMHRRDMEASVGLTGRRPRMQQDLPRRTHGW